MKAGGHLVWENGREYCFSRESASDRKAAG